MALRDWCISCRPGLPRATVTGSTVTGRSAHRYGARYGCWKVCMFSGLSGRPAGRGEKVSTTPLAPAPADNPAVLGLLSLMLFAEHCGSFAQISTSVGRAEARRYGLARPKCAHADLLAVTDWPSIADVPSKARILAVPVVPVRCGHVLDLFRNIAPLVLRSLGTVSVRRKKRGPQTQRWKELAAHCLLVYVPMSAPGRNQKQGRGVLRRSGADAARRRLRLRPANCDSGSAVAGVAMAESEV
jgi:hypothetical protein